MKKHEIMVMRYGEMQDMIACMAVEEGGAEQKIRRRMSYEDVMRMS